MAFFNKDGKIFGKISIIDITVVLVIIAVAFGAYLRFFRPEEKVTTVSHQLEYTVQVRGVREGTVKALQQKGEITNNNTHESVGEITDVTFEEMVETRELLNGTVVPMTIPERYIVEMKVRLDGSVNDSGFFTATNQHINIGSTLYFSTKYANTSGTIVDIKQVD